MQFSQHLTQAAKQTFRDAHACHKQTRDMQYHATTHSRQHAQAQPHAAAPEQQHPHSSPRHLLSTTPRHKQTLQIQPVNGLARSETAQNPLPEYTQASQNPSRSQPQQIGGTEQMEAHLGFFSLVDAVHSSIHNGYSDPSRSQTDR